MRTEDLAAFRAVVDAGSVSAAARALGRSQPGLSRQVQRLETDLAARLLDRDAAGIRLTAAGEQVLAFAIETLDALAGLRACVRDDAANDVGLMRVMASTVPGEHLVPAVIARFTQARPDLRVDLSIADSAAVVVALLERRADMGFTGIPTPHGRLSHVPFATDEVVLAVPAEHPLARRRTVPAAALDGLRLIAREEGSGTQRTFEDALAAADASLTIQTTVSLGSSQAVIAAVEAGLGIGVVSHRAIAEHHPGRIAPLRIENVTATRTLWLVYETARRRPPSHAAFIALATRFGESTQPGL